MAICKQCKAEFEAKRADALYCSSQCRKTANRDANRAVTDKSVTDNVSQINLELCQHCGELLDKIEYLEYVLKAREVRGHSDADYGEVNKEK